MNIEELYSVNREVQATVNPSDKPNYYRELFKKTNKLSDVAIITGESVKNIKKEILRVYPNMKFPRGQFKPLQINNEEIINIMRNAATPKDAAAAKGVKEDTILKYGGIVLFDLIKTGRI